MAGLVIVVSVAIGFSDTKTQTAQMVFTAVVRLLASWVGAVLAHYYSGKSLEAATSSVKESVPMEDRLRSIPVSNVMIKIEDMVYFPQDHTRKVQEVLQELKKSGKGERLPFLNDKKYLVYMLHKSAVDGALLQFGAGTPVAEITFEQLFKKVPDLKTWPRKLLELSERMFHWKLSAR